MWETKNSQETKDFGVSGNAANPLILLWCRRGESNSHGRKAHWILSPARLPVSPLRHLGEKIIARCALKCQRYFA